MPPNLLWMTGAGLPPSVMESWEEERGSPWLPEEFFLSTPPPPPDGAPSDAASEQAGGVEATAGAEDATAAPTSAGAAAADVGASVDGDAPAATDSRPIATEERPCTSATAGVDVAHYRLQGLICFTQSTLAHAADGSGHLTLFYRVQARGSPRMWPSCATPRACIQQTTPRACILTVCCIHMNMRPEYKTRDARRET